MKSLSSIAFTYLQHTLFISRSEQMLKSYLDVVTSYSMKFWQGILLNRAGFEQTGDGLDQSSRDNAEVFVIRTAPLKHSSIFAISSLLIMISNLIREDWRMTKIRYTMKTAILDSSTFHFLSRTTKFLHKKGQMISWTILNTTH